MFHNVNKLNPNPCIYDRIVSVTAAGSGNDSFSDSPKNELDSHANMVVLGKHSFIFEKTGRTCAVQPHDPSLGSAQNAPPLQQ